MYFTCFGHFQSHMPPFQAEPAERGTKPLPFLCFRNDLAQTRKRTVFGSEAAETESDRPVAKARPASSSSSLLESIFQPQPEELPRLGHKKARAVFGDEPAEDDGGYEGDSSNNASDAHSDADFAPTRQTVFSLGWQAVTSFEAATGWSRGKMDDPNSVRPKRLYNNEKRSSEAMYARKKAGSAYQSNGRDPERLQALFMLDECRCAPHALKCFDVAQLRQHWPRCSQTLLQTVL